MSIVTLKSKISHLPKSPGVYEFRDKQGKILYIGKATNLRDRVRSYFRGIPDEGLAFGNQKTRSLFFDRPNIEPMILQIADVKIHQTDSVLEALILESNLIKKYQPKYNIEGKDDKSFVQVVITKENFPRVLVDRIQNSKFKIQNDNVKFKNYLKIFGPYTSKKQLEIALKLIRKIFPYHSAKQISKNCCFDFQIGLCPGPHAGAISRKDYLKNIRGIEMILQGKKKKLLAELGKKMRKYSRLREFEKAAETRNRIFALRHIRDVALITSDEKSQITNHKSQIFRIEAYDISNIGGDFAAGSMVVFSGSKPDKSQYRKFRVRTIGGIDDVGMMREVLRRRFRNEWPLPDLIFVDGGKGHLNMAQNVLAEFGRDIPVVGVAKGPNRKKADVYYKKEALAFREIISNNRLVERIRNEAHRFAINYHKKLRRKGWQNGS